MSAKPKSGAWKYFVLSEDKTRTKCNLCNVSLAYSGGTSSMRNHLKIVHKRVKLLDDESPDSTSMKRQTSLAAWHKSATALGQGKYTAINRSLAVMCGVDLRPMNIANGRGFREFCHQINPLYKVPSDTTLSNYVKLVYDETKEKVLRTVSGSIAALTTDMWTSLANRAYMTVTCHLISKDWKLENIVLATRETSDRHTGINIAKHLKDIEQEFNIHTVIALVTDNARNMLVAAEEAKYVRQSCFSHTLQLCINDGLKQATVTKAVATAKRLVGHFSHSTIATQALHEHQQKMGNSKPISLIQDVATRWNSTFLMIRRLLKLRVSVYGVLWDETIIKQSERASFDLKDSVWKLLEDMVVVLDPLADATQLMTSESLPTCSSVYIILQNILPYVARTDGDSVALSEMKKTIRDNITRRFNVNDLGHPDDGTLNDILAVSTLLDPRSKSLRCMPLIKREKIQDNIVALMDQTHEEQVLQAGVHIKQEAGQENISQSEPKKPCLMDCLAPDVVDLTTESETASAEHELEAYISEPVRVLDPLIWWRNNASKFPRLAKLAKRFLCVPATEVPSERSFSTAGGTVTKLRASLSSDNVDRLTFIHKNYVFPERLPIGGIAGVGKCLSTTIGQPFAPTAPVVVKTEDTMSSQNAPDQPQLPSLDSAPVDMDM